jgi:hypothetical protein
VWVSGSIAGELEGNDLQLAETLVGGIVGDMLGAFPVSSITASHNMASVTALSSDFIAVGGIAGETRAGVISRCYNRLDYIYSRRYSIVACINA